MKLTRTIKKYLMIIKEKQANLILLMLESEVSRKIRNELRWISWSFSAFNTENM